MYLITPRENTCRISTGVSWQPSNPVYYKAVAQKNIQDLMVAMRDLRHTFEPHKRVEQLLFSICILLQCSNLFLPIFFVWAMEIFNKLKGDAIPNPMLCGAIVELCGALFFANNPQQF
jgi:hypothetical protein